MAIALAACGGGGNTVSASSYVHRTCGALQAWRTTVQSETTKMTSSLAGVTSLQTGKQTLTNYLTTVGSDTDTMISRVKDAGTPNTPNGSAAASELLDALSKLRGALATAKKQSESISTSSPQAFKSDAQRVSSSIESSFARVGSSLSASKAKSPALDSAFSRDAACRGIG